MRKEFQPRIERRDFIEVQRQHEDAIGQPVLARAHVGDVAGIDGRLRSCGKRRARRGKWMRPDWSSTRPRAAHTAKLFGDGEARLQSILVKARAEISAAEPGIAHALQRPELLLRADGGGVEERMIVVCFDKGWPHRAAWFGD